jgi:TonB-dependent receptor
MRRESRSKLVRPICQRVKHRGFVGTAYLTLLILTSLATIPETVRAQGSLSGVVADSVSREALIGANVFLPGTPLGGTTDREGRFRVTNIPEGSYRVRLSYIGYLNKEVSVQISAQQPTVLTVFLIPDVVEGEEVVITAQARGQIAAINQQLASHTIVNVISEEKIRELPDANAAEAIGRLPGVSILRSGGEANKVILRGLSDRFTTVTVDGIKIPPTDADSRGVDLSTISQGSLAGVELYKALTPDKDADAIGGSVNLVTKKAPVDRFIRLDARGNYNHLMTAYEQYDFALRYGERFFDNLLGVQVIGNLERRNRSNERIDLDYNQNVQGGRDYEINDFNLQFTDEIRKRKGASVLLDVNTPDEGTITFNNIFSETDRSYLVSTRNYPFGSSLRVNYSARDREQELRTFTSSLQGKNFLGSLTVAWGLSFAQSNGEFPYDYTIDFIEPSILDNGVVVAGMRSNVPSLRDHPEQLIPYALNNFQAAYVNNAYFRTEKNLDKERTAFLDLSRDFRIGDQLSLAVKTGGKYKVKDRLKQSGQLYSPYYLGYWRDFTSTPDGSIQKKDFRGTWFEPFYNRFLIDGTARNAFALDFLDPSPASRNLYDQYDLRPLVNRDALRLWYDLNKSGVDSLGRSREYYVDPSVDADFYDVVERISSGYAMGTLHFGENVTLIAGLRVEHEDNDYRSKFSPTGLGGFPIPSGRIRDTLGTYDETVWLPNLHLTLRPTDFAIVRFAAYRALSRPDFNLRLEKFVSQGGGGAVSLLLGNPNLKTAKAWNYEINTSLFGNTIGLVSLSAFYKEIDDLHHVLNDAYTIGNSIIDTLGIAWRTPHTGSYALTAPYNSPKPTKVWGFEFEHQMNLNFLPGVLKNVVLSYNASVVRSETYIVATDTFSVNVKQATGLPPPFDSISVPITNNKIVEKKQKLEGQPEFFANIALGYDIAGFSIRLSLFHQSEYNLSFSASGLSDQVVNSFTRIDLALKQDITENISLLLNLNNLTNADESNSIYNRSTGWKILNTSEQYGLTADLGIRIML